MCLTESLGGNFKLLGVGFDPCLSMEVKVDDVVVAAGWKLHMLVRTTI